MRVGVLSGLFTDEFPVSRGYLPNNRHSWWGGHVGWLVRDTHSLETSYMLICLSFESQGWFIMQKTVGSELASCLMDCAGWSPSVYHSCWGSFSWWNLPCCKCEPAGQKWRPGLREFLWSPLLLPQDVFWLLYGGCCNCAVPNLRPYHSWTEAQGWVLLVPDFLMEFSGLLNPELLKTEIVLIWGFQLNSQTIHYFENSTWS